MNFFRFIFLLFIFSSCEDLSFNNADSFSVDEKTKTDEEVAEIKSPEEKKTEIDIPLEENSQTEESKEISEEEITFISEDLELSENTSIQNKKVVLDMVTIKTLQYDLTIIADEFLSNHSVIQNFTDGQKAMKKEHGKKRREYFN